MDDAGLATATYWAPLLETIADIAFAIVIVALAVELVSGRIAKRFERQIDSAREVKIAELNNETARLRKQIAPRWINDEKEFLKSIEELPMATARLLYSSDDQGSLIFSMQLMRLLTQAGWTVSKPEPIPYTEVVKLVGILPASLGIVAPSISDDERKATLELGFGRPGVKSPYSVLVSALLSRLGSFTSHVDPSLAPNSLVIVIGPKA